MARWKVERFLKKQSQTRNFKIAFAFPSKEEMRKNVKEAPVVESQNEEARARDFEALRSQYLRLKYSALRTRSGRELDRKEAALEPITRDLWEYQRAWMSQSGSATGELERSRNELTSNTKQKLSEANSYSEIYRLIGQELWVADALLGSKNSDHRKTVVSRWTLRTTP